MDTTEHSRADQVFNDALDQTATDRAGFLDRTCAGDAGLRSEVESLLSAHEAAEGFLKTPIIDRTQSDEAHANGRDLTGELIDRYRIESLIATGGMGAVYRAVRADGQFEKSVAIKLIKRGMASRNMLARFHRERQTLARLEHPNITRLLDGGMTDEGLPYLVMEYVDGLPIDRYCDSTRLSIRARLLLFVEVCEAVQYAHQALTVHRDLKPGNILVSVDGTPKLVDFGIAKLIDADGNERGTGATVTLMRRLTPRYASPEQIRGEPMTTATDVYSLGVILYELLTGRCPFPIDARPGFEQERVICEDDPLAPSTTVIRSNGFVVRNDEAPTPTPGSVSALRGERPEHLRRTLRGDLDNIVLTAMHKDANRRYASAQQFADDIRNYLNHLPVSARANTLAYRTAKLIRRNKAASVASMALALALMLGIAGTSLGLVKARRAEQVARADHAAAVQAQAEAEAVTAFLGNQLAAANPYRRGRRVTVMELLKHASQRIDAELGDKPAVEAGVRYAIANTYAGMWHWQRVTPHVRRALEINRRLYGNADARVARCLSLLGRARTFARDPHAIALQEEGLDIRRKIFGPEHPMTAESLSNLGYALWHTTGEPQWERAEKCYRDAIAIYGDPEPQYLPDLARFTFSLAVMLHNRGRYKESESFFLEANAMFREMPGTEDRYRIESLNMYADLLNNVERFAEAEAVLSESLALMPAGLAGGAIDRRTWKRAALRDAGGDRDGAANLFRNALRISCEFFTEAAPKSADDMRRILDRLPHQGTLSDSVPVFREAFTEFDSLIAEFSFSMAEAMQLVASRLCAHGDHKQAGQLFEQCLAYQRTYSADSDSSMAHLRASAGTCAIHKRDFNSAERLLTQSYSQFHSFRGDRYVQTRKALRRLVTLYDAWGKPDRAAEYRSRMIDQPGS